MEQIKKLTAPLKDEDIEFRVGNVSVGKGFSVLAYKTARTDVNRLNDVFGLNWSNRYFYDDNKLLCCEISVFDGEKWISRTDVGTESFTEKEKGSYSDAFKRAGFKWGIGIELYKFPFIWIPHTNFDNKTPKGVYVQNWKKKGDIIVDDKGNIMYRFNQKKQIAPKKIPVAPKKNITWLTKEKFEAGLKFKISDMEKLIKIYSTEEKKMKKEYKEKLQARLDFMKNEEFNKDMELKHGKLK